MDLFIPEKLEPVPAQLVKRVKRGLFISEKLVPAPAQLVKRVKRGPFYSGKACAGAGTAG